MNRKSICRVQGFLSGWAILLVMLCTGCASRLPVQESHQTTPTDMPLNAFFMGRWGSTAAYGPDGKLSTYTYEVDVPNANQLKFIELTSSGYLLDGTTSSYTFTGSDTVFVDNRRIEGGEHWLLQRNGEDLIVYRTIGNGASQLTSKLVLRRKPG